MQVSCQAEVQKRLKHRDTDSSSVSENNKVSSVRRSVSPRGAHFPRTHGNRSWSTVYEPGHDYATQRPDQDDGSPGDVLVGGGFAQGRHGGLDLLGTWDDSRRDALPLAHVRGIMPTVFEEVQMLIK
ncbi:hypothetical protein NHJ13051_007331 [Beauveria bassiana]